ncbi:FHA domain-containing protein [Streptomyces sp. MI02-2A]|uniref:FHA domain-containing protein n=1 Tax=unclassified Streptomyces TaxID=2593676 RepID=UPI000E2535D4|nr:MULTISPECIES: FHA domain-containing protein [unclassified Streptomyces]MDX3264127.1 FHA domain-containing protein [Streptomyces sp. MI02-2A]REE60819.1 pSer/pThr/pTyr-binding forkhead associated (FHA) protein [Streptomyces sp. 3212.3]
MPTCPNGHQSGSDDWCEVCGHRMAGAVPPPPPPPPTAGYGFPPPGSAPPPPGPGGRPQSAMPNLEPELCPQCRTPREGGAPFCEECRWNFLTNTATSYTPAAPRPPAPNPALRFQQGGQTMPGPDSFDYERSRPSQVNRPAEPIPPGPPFGDEPSGPTGFGGASSRPSVFGNEPPRPPAFGGDTSPQPPYGTDPTRPGPPPGPAAGGPGGQQGGAPGAPSAFQGGAPSVFRRPTPPSSSSSQGFPPSAPPQQGGPSFGGGDEDWVISPPSNSPAPGAPGAGGQGGDYGFPQPGAAQAPPSPYEQQPATWTATIGPDREYFMAMMQRSGPEAAGLNLPAYSPEQQRTLTGNQITIGRRRHSTGDTPDIDLSVPPEDPGVSHQHALLVQQPDGSWAVVDQNSTNGTTVNGGEEPIQPFVPVPLQDGDRVHVGAWTTITIRRG